jgi:hypothetical protein
LSGELRAGLKLTRTAERAEALEDADFVIDTAQVGSHAWVEDQRTLVQRHGYCRGADLYEFGFHGFNRAGDRDLLLYYPLYEPRTTTLEQAEGLLGAWFSEPRSWTVAGRFHVE